MPCIDHEKLKNLCFDWKQLLALKRDGYEDSQIAEKHYLSTKGVSKRVSQVMQAFGTRNAVETVAVAVSVGLLPYDDVRRIHRLPWSDLAEMDPIILELTAYSFTSQEIAEALYISYQSVGYHFRIMRRKLCPGTPGKANLVGLWVVHKQVPDLHKPSGLLRYVTTAVARGVTNPIRLTKEVSLAPTGMQRLVRECAYKLGIDEQETLRRAREGRLTEAA